MTHFEYLTIAPALILSFSIARVFANLAPVFSAEKRYWIHSLWVALLVLNHVIIFWLYWVFEANQEWTLIEFVLFLIHPIGLLISATLLVPGREVADYRDYFESVRVPLYIVFAAALAADPITGWITLDIVLLQPTNLVTAAIVGLFVLSIFLQKENLDRVLVLLMSAVALFQLFMYRGSLVETQRLFITG